MSDRASPPLDLAALRARFAEKRGPAYWRSLEELAGNEEFRAHLEDEFPRFAAAAEGAFDRRRFLQLAAASLALSGLAACGQPPEEIVPNIVDPETGAGGTARRYATATTLGGYATGTLVKTVLGRPIKVEGNPDHPASLGATDVFAEASILDLYDPDRAKTVLYEGRIRTGAAFDSALQERIATLSPQHGEGLRILTGTVTSPTLAAQLAALQQRLPGMRWHRWEPLGRDTVRAGTHLAFGRELDVLPHVERADVILAVGSDLLSSAPGHLRFARDFAARRSPEGGSMSRLYAIESTPTLTGSNADHRFVVPPRELPPVMRALAAALEAGPAEWRASADAPWLKPLADDLSAHRGRALLHVGPDQSPEMHAIAHAINQALAAFGATVELIEPVEAAPVDHAQSIAELVDDMQAGRVDTLLVIGGNPVYSAPADLDFAGALPRVPFTAYLGLHANETGLACRWLVPEAHAFESWGDARAFDGTATIQQPLIRPLYGGRSAIDMLAALHGEISPDAQSIVRKQWSGTADAEGFWRSALRAGVVPNTRSPPVAARLRSDWTAALPEPQRGGASGVTVLFRPDPFLWDGSFANNGWLQELPRPLTRLTWDNAALVAPQTAERLGLADGEIVALEAEGRSIRAPVWILPGQAPDCVTLPLGFGRRAVGRVGSGAGFDAYPLRTRDALRERAGVTLAKGGGFVALGSTQHHQTMDGRDIVRTSTFDEYRRDPKTLGGASPDESLYPKYRYPDLAWGMAIDLNACIGCGACAIACQAENNVPVVGKEEVLRHREMHWLRVDRYWTGDIDRAEPVFQPVLCMHCEKAPCEVVCPVGATVHDSTGLNVMVYNRCVGTRFCSNNCPYKVRRFNYFDYSGEEQRPPDARNPDVTVRSRGVMEKCTYCLQRIAEARIAADRENRSIRDGEVVTACQAACPTRAIIFGNLNDPDSAVSKAKAVPRDYPLLADLNTRPRTTYGARIRNPNPAIENA